MTIEVTAVDHTYIAVADGIRLEIRRPPPQAHLIRDHWDQLTEFEDPVRKPGLV